ncbi:MAG: M20/M25/M40 family metallo-hydrolase [Pirellulales bacterium]|nr:M20/M25/M40 family metallo-hydrolase [Pirellulales bacterium]
MSTPEPDLWRAESLLLKLLKIAGPSCHEAEVAHFVTGELCRAGVPASAIETDQAHRRSRCRGDVGNLICRLPGTIRGPRRLFMAHMDTVPLCVGARPIKKGDYIVPADKHTALGADDRAGVAVVLSTVLEIIRQKLPHPPLTLFFSVQEELGLLGTNSAKFSALGKPRLAFNFDGGPCEQITMGATGGYRMTADVHGIASHAGCHPERGVSAITIASLAIAQLHHDGWLGNISKRSKTGTANVGVISGGDATNVVTPLVQIRTEARSHDPAFRKQIVAAIEKAFQDAATSVKNEDGRCGSVEFEGHLDYESFLLADDDPSLLACEAAVRDVGITPKRKISDGGLDANWMSVRLVPTVTMGAGQIEPHTVNERVDLREFRQVCRVALRLATGQH